MSMFTRSAIRALSHSYKSNAYIGSAGVCLQSHFLQLPTRSLAILSSSIKTQDKHVNSSARFSVCLNNGMHTKGDRELSEFLQREIAEEKKRVSSVPAKLDDFSVKQDGAVLVLTKNFHDEKITITLNVNHTVTGSDSQENDTMGELESRPDFEVDIQVGSKILSLTCQFTTSSDITEGDHVEDEFGIGEITLFEGEWEDKTYCVSGEIVDEVMYDLLMNMLEERGITNEFAQSLSKFCSDYEHSLFVNLLKSLQTFINRK